MGYTEFVESMIITEGQTRIEENMLGLMGEAGELTEKFKKKIRDGIFSADAIQDELGDVLFYTFALCNILEPDVSKEFDSEVYNTMGYGITMYDEGLSQMKEYGISEFISLCCIQSCISDIATMVIDEDARNMREPVAGILGSLGFLGDTIGCDIISIMERNKNKLTDRKERGKLQGSGDNR